MKNVFICTLILLVSIASNAKSLRCSYGVERDSYSNSHILIADNKTLKCYDPSSGSSERFTHKVSFSGFGTGLLIVGAETLALNCASTDFESTYYFAQVGASCVVGANLGLCFKANKSQVKRGSFELGACVVSGLTFALGASISTGRMTISKF